MKKWSLYLLFSLLLGACVAENDDPRPSRGKNGSELTLRIVFPDIRNGGISTRSITAEEETQIDSLDVFVFKPAGSNTTALRSDIFLYRRSLPKDSITDNTSSPYNREKTVGLNLEVRPEDQRLVVVANMPPNLDFSSLQPGVSTEDDLLALLKFSGAAWRQSQRSTNAGETADDYTALPMWGEMNAFVKVTTTGITGTAPTISMIRALAKIQLGVDVNGTGNPALGFGYIFRLDSIYLCNVSDSGYIAPGNTFIDGAYKTNAAGGVTLPHPHPSGRITNPAIYRFAFPGDGTTPLPSGVTPDVDRALWNTIYVPETDSLIGSTLPGFIVIKARYYDTPSGTPYFYRIDFSKLNGQNSNTPLLRNHKYLINILNIRLAGYATLQEAINAPVSDKNYEILIDGQSNNASNEINDIVAYKDEFTQNYQYMLGVNTSEVFFDWDQNWIGKPSSAPDNYFRLKMYTDYDGGWKAQVTSGSTWITLYNNLPDASGTITKPNPFVELPIQVTSNYMPNPATSDPLEREGEITLTAGLLTKKILIRQYAGANSVIVPSGIVSFRLPLTYVGVAREEILGSGSGAFVATQVIGIWQTDNVAVGGLALGANYVEVQNPLITSGANGGFGLALTNATDTIWSWHIWVTTPTDITNINGDFHNPNTPVFMNRMLGNNASNSDPVLYYQWGRKDPFVITSFGTQYSTLPTSGNAAMIATAIRHPNVFYTNSSPPYYNWAGTYYSNSLWNDANGRKTPHDPCPAGWRIPQYSATNSPWQNVQSSELPGYNHTGYLDATSGNRTGVTQGRIWSASTVSFNAVFGNINGTTVNPMTTGSRGHGIAVRCVKDISKKY